MLIIKIGENDIYFMVILFFILSVKGIRRFFGTGVRNPTFFSTALEMCRKFKKNVILWYN